jgi:glycosyltransferase involved in cell wall biosynthesis
LKISALIPTYNRRTQVLRAIDSVLAQTIPVDEIIVVDDGSTDGSAEAIRLRYGSRVVLLQQENAGVSSARNHGIREARGEWIGFLDSDDVWCPTKIERQREALVMHGEAFGVCFTDCIYEGNPDRTLSVFQETGFEGTTTFGSLNDPAKYVLTNREPFWTQSLLVRRSLLEGISGFDEALVVREDTDVLFRLSFRTRFCFAREPLVRIDRSPFRDGLCNLYLDEEDLIYECLELLYSKWLDMFEVRGTEYEAPIREMLRLMFYDSAESKIHHLRITSAFRQIGRLRCIEGSYSSIYTTLLTRKIRKLRCRFGGMKSLAQENPESKCI